MMEFPIDDNGFIAMPPNHSFNRTRRYGAIYLARAGGGGPANLVLLGRSQECV